MLFRTSNKLNQAKPNQVALTRVTQKKEPIWMTKTLTLNTIRIPKAFVFFLCVFHALVFTDISSICNAPATAV